MEPFYLVLIVNRVVIPGFTIKGYESDLIYISRSPIELFPYIFRATEPSGGRCTCVGWP
jgi:hypothetical protein